MAIPSTDAINGLGVRTLNPGDVAVKIVDATTTSQGLNVDANGFLTIKLDDGAGNIVTSQVNGAQRALDVGINVAGVQVDPRQIRSLTAADIVTVQQGTTPWSSKDQADGPVAPGTAASYSMLVGGVFNSTAITLASGQQSAIQLTASGAIVIRPLASGTDGVTAAQGAPAILANAWPSKITDGTNAMAVKAASTAAAAADPSAVVALSPNSALPPGTNALGSVEADLRVGHNDVSLTNPVPVVVLSSLPGNQINNYFTSASNVAYGASDVHTYTVSTGKTLNIKKIWASASGRIRIDVAVSTNGTTFTTVYTAYNSTVSPNITIDFDVFSLQDSGTGSEVQITRYNEEYGSQPFAITSTISGTEN